MYRIGILQLTQHLDDAVNGFRQRLTELGLDVEYDYRNADGAAADLPRLADQLSRQSVDLIFACSTPAAQAAIALPGNIPVVFTPVFDPVGAGLIASLSHPGGKATGMAGMVPVQKKLAFIQELLPQARVIGLLYHTGDSNGLLEADLFRQTATDYQIVDLPISRPDELSLLPDMLQQPLDALFLPISRIVEENFATVAYYAEAAGLPVIASHGPNVPAGALAALTANHRRLGCACADQARQILTGTSPATIAVGVVNTPDILLNVFVAANLGVPLSPELLARAAEIYE